MAGFEWDGVALCSLGRRVLPEHFEPRDATGDERRVFVGGRFEPGAQQDAPFGPALLSAEIAQDGPWRSLEVKCPSSLRHAKAVDGVVVVGDELLGIDDVVLPKFIERFDLRADPPRRTGSADMPRGINEETAPGVAVNGEWLAVRAQSHPMHVLVRSVTLYRLPDLRAVARLGESLRDSGMDWRGWERELEDFHYFNATFVGDRLVLACGQKGIACVDCAGVEALAPRTVARQRQRWNPRTRTIDPPEMVEEVVDPLVDLRSRTRWRGCGESVRVVDVTGVPSLDGVVAVEENRDGRRRACWVSLREASAWPRV